MKLPESDVLTELERVLESRTFEGSETRKALLRYLVAKSLAGEGEQLKEYTIAVDALGKASSYDPRRDSTVRIQVGRLRQKLIEYYAEEGAADPLIVALHKGSYRVDFSRADEPVPEAAAPSRWRTIGLAGFAVAILAIGWAVYGMVEVRRLRTEVKRLEEAWTPELREMWAPLIDGPRPVIVCVGVPAFANFSTNVFLRVSGANSWEETIASPRFAAVQHAFPGATTVPWYAFTGVGEANGAFLVGKLLGARESNIEFTRSNLLSFQQMSDSNLVFIGPPKFNSQLSAIPIKPAMLMEANGVRLLNPARGEQEMYTDSFAPGAEFNGATYALISRTPGLSGNGTVLILAGNGTPDTLAAAQWVTQPKRAGELCSRLRLPSGQLPRYFQALLKVQFRNGVPVDSAYVLHRAIGAN